MASNKKHERTTPIRRSKPAAEKPAVPPRSPALGVAWLWAYQPQNAFQVHALLLDKPVVVGRTEGETVDFAIDDRSVSRRHAAFVLRHDGVHVKDLDSTNHVCVRGQPVREAVLTLGDEVLLGEVRVVVRGDAGSDAGVDYDRLLGSIGAEITRSNYFERQFVLAAVRKRTQRGSDEAHVIKFVDVVMRTLRPVDQFAFYGPEVLILLLPEINKRDAQSRLGKTTSRLLDVGFAAYPEDGQTVYELEEKCLTAMHHGQADVRPQEPVRPVASEFVVASPAMVKLLDEADRYAQADMRVMIRGETGVGKEHVARHSHQSSKRRKGPFVAINCATIQKELAESILFGHVKGAFTGAHEAQDGLFKLADGGTLFLDEVAELPLATQATLLRVLQERTIRPLGAKQEITVDVHVIAATHQNIEQLIGQGKFREDLYYRLAEAELQVPPLHERRVEIPLLVTHFIRKFVTATTRPLPEASKDAMELLEAFEWPGNIRELGSVIKRALAMSQGETIEPRHLPVTLQSRGQAPVWRQETMRPGPGVVQGKAAAGNFWEEGEQAQRRLTEAALEATHYNVAKAAEAVGLKERTMRHHIKKLKISLPTKKPG